MPARDRWPPAEGPPFRGPIERFRRNFAADGGYAKRLHDIRVRDEQDLAPVDVFSGRVQGASAPVSPIETSTSARRPPLAPKIRIIDFLADHT